MATNRIDILDPALLRPGNACVWWCPPEQGRIDRKIEFPNPNEMARLDILKIHSRRMNLTRQFATKKKLMLKQRNKFEENIWSVTWCLWSRNKGILELWNIDRFIGCLYRSWHVRTTWTKSSRHPGRFWNGSFKSDEKGFGQEYVFEKAVEVKSSRFEYSWNEQHLFRVCCVCYHFTG